MPDGSAMLDVKSNNKGLLPPRMTRAEIDAIASPADGLIVYCRDCGVAGAGALSIFMAGTWFKLAVTNMDLIVSTIAISAITSSTASSGGNITSDGGSTITARGVCWGTSANPTISSSKNIDGSGIGSFTSTLTGLIPNTTYYARAYATNSAGTGYGNEISFKTLVGNTTVTDIDGNVYNIVTIGTQTWMVENLKTTKYRNSEAIPNVTDGATWGTLTTGAYCWYNNDAANKSTYGGLYNWYAVADSRNIAPVGWHVPTDSEWTTLTTYLGGVTVAGGKLKEPGTTHWYSPNADATNSSGFTALPGGCRSPGFGDIGGYCYWWSSTEYSATHAWRWGVYYSYGEVSRSSYSKYYGYSVRCLRD